MSDEVQSRVADGIATLTINRPEQRNALSPSALEALRAEFARLGADPDVGVIVLTGAGDKAFCSGADMGSGSSGVFNDPQSYEAYQGRAGFPDLFESMHEGWVTDEARWPKNRTFEMFREWFEVQMSSIAQDLYLDEPLHYIG